MRTIFAIIIFAVATLSELAAEEIDTAPEISPPTAIEEEKVIQPVKEPELKPEPKKYEWRTVDISELPQHIRKPVKVETTRGTTRTGFLNNLTKRTATVGRSSRPSGIAYEIPISEIKSIKVYDIVQ